MGGNYALDLTNPPALLARNGISDPIGEFKPFMEVVQATGNYKQLLLGRPVATWHWGMLEQFEMDFLIQFVTNGPAPVYIKTRVPDGKIQTYRTFSALMQYPTKMTSKPGGLWADVEVVFNNLVQV